ncbi:uncharacterized protein C4orf54-like [Stegostoma tigrinum]|uniref:uncharacterized protein C4orf54-like n=1 Tax=Stegostoma tigrinum TaxID=3053191 RepID=UPI00202B67A3|nr:uncharacterized protein C4orf54-like [Stegostoma tigrinum]
MLCLHVSVAGSRGAAANRTLPAHGTGHRTAALGRVSNPRRRALSGEDPAERPETPGAEREGAPMRREGDSRRINAGGAETRAGESGCPARESPADFSGYETAAGLEICESFSDSDKGGSAGQEAALRLSSGSQLERKVGGERLDGKPGGGEGDYAEVWSELAAGGGDELHFISTHQIQLYELDHDGCEFALGSSCALEESSAVYSLVSSSSPETDASEEGSVTPQAPSCAEEAPPEEAPVQESVGAGDAPGQGGAAISGGPIHLSIRASSRAVGEERQACADGGWRGGGGARRAGVPAERSRCSSSAVSELDEADKEVRSLTARSFRSLACGGGDEYLDTYCAGNRSTDLSSLSEGSIGCSRWAQYVDAHCRKSMGLTDRSEFPAESANRSVSAPGQDTVSRNGLDGGPGERSPQGEGPQPASATQENSAQCSASQGPSGEAAQLGSRVITLAETVKLGHDPKEHGRQLRGNSGAGGPSEESAAGVGGPERRRSGAKMARPQHKSKLASSLLQNIIWKRMQFEQELRMERGEISDTSSPGRCSPPAEAPRAPEPGHSARANLFASQRSAFRAWADGADRSAKAGQSVRAEIGTQAQGKATKMSHLFVPGIQRAPTGTGPRKAAPQPPRGRLLPQGAAETKSAAVRSPEIRIKVRSRYSPGPEAGPEARCQVLLADAGHGAGGRARAQHFTVRDIRDNIQRIQAPLHRVRDVRKLLKSSYHIVTVHGGTAPREGSAPAPATHRSPSLPIVIKCQAVSKGQLPGSWKSRDRPSGGGGSPENAVTDSPVPLPAASPEPPDTAMIAGSSSVPRARLPITGPGRAAASPPATGGTAPGPDKALGTGCQAEASKRLALEKLTAAVKSMEQLYVFDRNEWKRKTDAAPGTGALAGSHVLSLIASEEASSSDREAPAAARAPDPTRKAEPSAAAGVPKTPGAATAPQLFTVAPVSQAAPRREFEPSAAVRSPPVQPEVRSVRAPRRPSLEETEKPADGRSGGPAQPQAPPAEFENYLTIPIKQPPAAAPAAAYSVTPGRLHSPSPKQQREPSPATIYHQPPSQRLSINPAGVQPPEPISQAKLVESSCFPAPHTQRKMLLDPATGQYYLVDTPVRPARKRLYDPETGQFVDVPMTQQTMAPVSVPISPIAINPSAYGTSYMLYPGFLPTPAVLPPVQGQLPRADSECNDSVKPPSAISHPGEAQYAESPYYFPTGRSLNPTQSLTSQHTARATQGVPDGKPVISITSQPGPRIIAPPSFDGTTMSFIVEHR